MLHIHSKSAKQMFLYASVTVHQICLSRLLGQWWMFCICLQWSAEKIHYQGHFHYGAMILGCFFGESHPNSYFWIDFWVQEHSLLWGWNSLYLASLRSQSWCDKYHCLLDNSVSWSNAFRYWLDICSKLFVCLLVRVSKTFVSQHIIYFSCTFLIQRQS